MPHYRRVLRHKSIMRDRLPTHFRDASLSRMKAFQRRRLRYCIDTNAGILGKDPNRCQTGADSSVTRRVTNGIGDQIINQLS